MPTVAIEGAFKFVVNTRENAFEPPHVHIWIGNEDTCRIDLNSGEFMENPPPRYATKNPRDIQKACGIDQKGMGSDSWELKGIKGRRFKI
ncbi:MAG: DUF4160 domain-containing protein [Chloroflexi bacterium]|nr:DUF4160 domain-containing protein [Chloroflexota bacterium]